MRKNFNAAIEKMLGQILVERNIISPMQLQVALDRQKKQKGKYKYIGEILIEMGIPQEKINEALDLYHKRKPIGQILLDLKIITPDQLQTGARETKPICQEWLSVDLWVIYWSKWGISATMNTWMPFPDILICQSSL